MIIFEFCGTSQEKQYTKLFVDGICKVDVPISTPAGLIAIIEFAHGIAHKNKEEKLFGKIINKFKDSNEEIMIEVEIPLATICGAIAATALVETLCNVSLIEELALTWNALIMDRKFQTKESQVENEDLDKLFPKEGITLHG